MPRTVFNCRLSDPREPFEHFWEHTVGSDHAPIALRADWQEQLRRCRQELGFRYVRFHGILSDDMGTLICHKERPLYSFFNIDQIIDFLLSIGMKPFVELGFMPWILASGPKTVFRYRGNVTPPKDFGQWSELIRMLAEHWVRRYGRDEVRSWFFEVWNEPNLHHFWSGTQADYFELYRHTAFALKDVDEELRVGGPATAKNQWIADFVHFCESNRVALDFISTHHYPTDTMEETELGDEEDDTVTQLANSRRGILREWTAEVKRQAGGRAVYYTEWNTSSNPRDPLHDEPFAAAFVTKTIMEAAGLVAGYGFWTFTDIFAENYFPSEPFHGGFGLLTLHGIAKPAYRAFEILHRLGDVRYLVEGRHETVDLWVVGGRDEITVLITNHALPRHPIQCETIQVRLSHAPRPISATIERIDEDHANPKRLWRELGEPMYLNPDELLPLQDAARLDPQSHPWRYNEGTIDLEVELPPHAVAAITVKCAPNPT
jgi:xylan 1,4-beta-xylosidase